MPKAITQGSTLTCAHQGRIQLTPSQTVLKIDGQAVLVDGDLIGAPIANCTTPITQSSKKCTAVVGMTAGAAMKLKAGCKAVLLETATGNTDGVTPVPSNFWSVQSAGQTKLDAV